jgi:glutamine synthetase
MEIGATVLPHFPKDTTDRNRTSPFAFTGNKFEFRMLGSAFSIAGPVTVLNTIIADVLSRFADELENSRDFQSDLSKLVIKTIKDHKRIIFNGNGYDASWVKEAKQRGLSNLKTTPEALPALIHPKNVDLFVRHGVFTKHELYSRYEILLENYAKTIHIEALTMMEMVNKQIVPAVIGYQKELADLILQKRAVNLNLETDLEENLLNKISKLSILLEKRLNLLAEQILAVRGLKDKLAIARTYREKVYGAMVELRFVVDELEMLISGKHWTIPTYTEILNSLQ